MDFSKFLDLLKQPASYLLVFGLAGVAVVFLPDKPATSLGFNYLRANYLPWVSLATIIFLGLAIVGLGKAGLDRFINWRLKNKAKWQFLKFLPSLTAEERFYLAYCLSRQTNTILLGMGNPASGSLCSKGLLLKVGGVGNAFAWPHLIPENVWQYIRQNPGIVVHPTDLRAWEPTFKEFEADTRRNAF